MARKSPISELATMTTSEEDDEFAPEQVDVPLHWPSIDHAEFGDELISLYEWVVRLQERFPTSFKQLPTCWYRHNEMVELLSALRDDEKALYSPEAPLIGSLKWQLDLRDVDARAEAYVKKWPCSEVSDIDVDRHHLIPGTADASVPDHARAWIRKADAAALVCSMGRLPPEG